MYYCGHPRFSARSRLFLLRKGQHQKWRSLPLSPKLVAGIFEVAGSHEKEKWSACSALESYGGSVEGREARRRKDDRSVLPLAQIRDTDCSFGRHFFALCLH